MSECVRGCSMRDKHLSECEGDCWGCLPRQAQRGDLCQPCHRRLELMLHDAPTVDAWLTANLGGSGSVEYDRPKVDTSRGSPAPLSAAIFDVRQELRDRLASWVDNWIADSPDDLKGPERHTVEADAAYLTTWLDRLERTPWVGDMWEELAETMRDAHALAPWRPKAKRWPGLPCPECERVELIMFGGEDDVTCLACKSMFTEQQMAHWRLVCHEAAERAS